MKILIVDDHQIVRYGLKLVLQEIYKDAVILEAEDLDCAVNLIAVNDLRLIIFNIDLQDAGGLESLIRFIVNEAKVVIFSGYDKKHELIDSLLFAGAHALILKDSSLSEMKKMLAALFEEVKI